MTINLIPPKLKKEQQNRKVISYAFTGLFILLVIFTIISATVYAAAGYTQGDLISAQNKLDEANSRIKKYSDLEKKVNATNAKIGSIYVINQDKVIWSNVISNLSLNTPVNMQIKTLTVNSVSKNLTIQGTAASRTDVADFKEKLEGSKYFQNVIFEASSLNPETNDYSFSLTCDLKESK